MTGPSASGFRRRASGRGITPPPRYTPLRRSQRLRGTFFARPHIETRSFLTIKGGPAGIGHFGPGCAVAHRGRASAVQGRGAVSWSFGWAPSPPGVLGTASGDPDHGLSAPLQPARGRPSRGSAALYVIDHARDNAAGNGTVSVDHPRAWQVAATQALPNPPGHAW